MAECEGIRARLLEAEPDDPASLAAHLATCAGCARVAERLRGLDGAFAELAASPAPAPPPFERLAPQASAAARHRRRLVALRRARPFALTAVGGMALVAAVVLIFGRTRPVTARRAPVVAGALLHGPTGAVLGDGAQVTLHAGEARVEASDAYRSTVQLRRGQVLVEVPHLHHGATMAVLTDEAEVRVHGTRFVVTRDDSGSRVEVSEGVVEVRPRDALQPAFLLHAGESALVEDALHARRSARARAIAALENGQGAQAEASLGAWLAYAPPSAEAAEAHALIAWKRSADGDRAGALAEYRLALELLGPDLRPLWADNALAQLALLVERDDAAAGAALWRSYLERFPGGAHAALARDRLAHRP